MSNPLDATPMQLREELAIVWSIVEQEKEFSSRLKKALSEREKQVTLLRDVVGHVAGMRFSIMTTKMCEVALATTEPKP